MFKKVTHVGVTDPALRSLVDRAMPILADEIQTWREDVEVAWDASGSAVKQESTEPDMNGPGVWLELRLALPNSTGVVRRLLTRDVLADDRRLRAACRSVWSRLLDKLLDQQSERLRGHLLQATES